MGAITNQIATVFRDHVTAGVASSGVYDPPKSEIRAIGPVIEASIANAALGALVDLTKDTKANLDLDLAHAADTVALVCFDSTDENNDLYIKVGASGSGSWTNTGALHAIVDLLISPYVDPVLAAAAAFTRAVGLAISTGVTIEEGGRACDYSLAAPLSVTRFFGVLVSGTGTMDVTFLVDGLPVYGPVTISTTATENTGLAFTIPAGSDVQAWIDNITGSPDGAFIKLEGMSA